MPKIVQIKSNKQIKESKLGGAMACISIAINLALFTVY